MRELSSHVCTLWNLQPPHKAVFLPTWRPVIHSVHKRSLHSPLRLSSNHCSLIPSALQSPSSCFHATWLFSTPAPPTWNTLPLMKCQRICASDLLMRSPEALLKVLLCFLQIVRWMHNQIESKSTSALITLMQSLQFSFHLAGVHILPILSFFIFTYSQCHYTFPESFPSGMAVNCCYHLPPEIKLPHILTAWHRWWLFKTLWLLSPAWLAVLWRQSP